MAVPSFNNPFMLGFDNLEEMLTRVAKSTETFPPYNIEQLSENHLRLSLAVAGYREEELDVSVVDNQLVIKGRQESDANRHFLHKGIAARAFVKSFVLADGLLVGDAFMELGLLQIDLHRPIKKASIKKIKIQKEASHHALITVPRAKK